MERLMKYHWPGNIRELQNVLEKAIVLARSPFIEKVDLPMAEYAPEPKDGPGLRTQLPLSEWISAQEREYLILKLKACRGRVGLAAKSCGVDVRTMYRKMRLYGLDKKKFNTNA